MLGLSILGLGNLRHCAVCVVHRLHLKKTLYDRKKLEHSKLKWEIHFTDLISISFFPTLFVALIDFIVRKPTGVE